MLEADPIALEFGSEAPNMAEGTYGRDDEGEGVEVGGCEGGGDTVARTPFVERTPAGRGARWSMFPRSSCLKVRGTSDPGLLSPRGMLAENNKVKPPVRR